MNLLQESPKVPSLQQQSRVSSFMDTQKETDSSDVTTKLQELIEGYPEPSTSNMEGMKQALISIGNTCREHETKSKPGNHEEWSITQDIVVCLPRLAIAIRKKFLGENCPIELKLESYQTICAISRLLIKEDYEFDEIFHIWRQRMVPKAFEDASNEEYRLAKWALKFLSLAIPDMSSSVLQDEESKKYVEWIANFPKSQQLTEQLHIVLRRASELDVSSDTLLARRVANLLSTWRSLSLKTRRYSSEVSHSGESVVDSSVSYNETSFRGHHDVRCKKENEVQSEDSQEVYHTPPSSKYRPKEESKLTRSAKKNLDSDDFAWITHNQAEVIEEFATSVRKHAEIVARMSNIGCLDNNELPLEKSFSGLALNERHVENEIHSGVVDSNKENERGENDFHKTEYASNEMKALREQVTKKALEEAGIVIEEYQNLLNKYQTEFRAKIELEHIVQQYEATLRKTISQSQSQINVRLVTLETEKRKLQAELMAMKEAQQQKLSTSGQIISMEQVNEKDERIRKQEEMLETLQSDLWKVEKDYNSLRQDAEMKLSQAFKQVCLYRDEYLKQSKALHNLQDEIGSLKKLLEDKTSEVIQCKEEKQKALEEKEKIQETLLDEKVKSYLVQFFIITHVVYREELKTWRRRQMVGSVNMKRNVPIVYSCKANLRPCNIGRPNKIIERVSCLTQRSSWNHSSKLGRKSVKKISDLKCASMTNHKK